MKVEALRPHHLASLQLQDAQAYFGPEMTNPEYVESLVRAGPCFAATDGSRVIGCAGVVEVWDNRAMAWALMSRDAGRQMLTVHRLVAGFLAQAKWRRIEATVDAGFEAGHRWMRLLGFTLETPEPMRAYRPDGGDCFLYARVK
jgi:uncharacterized protein YciI